jgi:YVTN family beta-propeller protein
MPSSFKPLFALAATAMIALAMLWSGCHKSEDTPYAPPPNRPPTIDSIAANHNPVGMNSEVVLTASTTDPDNDELIFTWSTFPEHLGYFPNESRTSSIHWMSPNSTGPLYLVTSATDGEFTARDSLLIHVQAAPQAQITSPPWHALYAEGTLISFVGEVSDAEDAPENLRVEWWDDLSGRLGVQIPDASGRVEYITTELSYAMHTVSLVVIDRDGLTDTARVMVDVLYPPPPVMYPPVAHGTSIALAWTPTPVADFDYYALRRGNSWGVFTQIAEIHSQFDTSYVDSVPLIGSRVYYAVDVYTTHGNARGSDSVGVTVGTTLPFNHRIGDYCFGTDPAVAYIALQTADSVVAVDLATGAVIHRVAVGEGPRGMAFVPALNELFVVNSGGHSVSVLSVPALDPVAEFNLPDAGSDIAYCAAANRLIVTFGGTSWGPVWLMQPSNGEIVATVEHSGFPGFSDALVVADSATPTIYIGETGGSPASLYKYSIADDTPQFLLEDEHGALGSNLQDMALMPDGQHILLACGAPYYIQVLSTADLLATGQLATDAYPNSVFAAANGTKVVAAHAMSDFMVYAMPSRVLLSHYSLVNNVPARGVAISPDGRYALAAFGDIVDQRAVVAIVELE